MQTIFEAMIYSQQRTERLLAVNVVVAATSLLFYAILIPPFGARGAAMATVASFSASFVTCIWLSRAFPRWFVPRSAESGARGSGAA